MNKPLWFPFYPNDFLGSTTVTLMSTEEIGAYVLLLCAAWQTSTCSLPDDDNSIRKLGRFAGDLSKLRACFVSKRGKLVNPRLTAEWHKAIELQRVRHNAAMKSNEVRWGSQTDRKRIAKTSSSQSQSQSQLQKNRRTEEQVQSESEKEVKNITQPAVRVSKTGPTWLEYKHAYEDRYRVSPVSNAKTNGQLAQVVNRLGSGNAPDIARFFVGHNDPVYVRSRHSINFLLRDCEGLHTQFVSGVRATTGEAKNAEQQDDATAQVKRVQAILNGGL